MNDQAVSTGGSEGDLGEDLNGISETIWPQGSRMRLDRETFNQHRISLLICNYELSRQNGGTSSKILKILLEWAKNLLSFSIL